MYIYLSAINYYSVGIGTIGERVAI